MIKLDFVPALLSVFSAALVTKERAPQFIYRKPVDTCQSTMYRRRKRWSRSARKRRRYFLPKGLGGRIKYTWATTLKNGTKSAFSTKDTTIAGSMRNFRLKGAAYHLTGVGGPIAVQMRHLSPADADKGDAISPSITVVPGQVTTGYFKHPYGGDWWSWGYVGNIFAIDAKCLNSQAGAFTLYVNIVFYLDLSHTALTVPCPTGGDTDLVTLFDSLHLSDEDECNE